MTVRQAPQAAALSLPLAGCAHEAIDAFAVGAIGFVGLFLASLLFVPRINDYLSRREHHERMYKRTPFSPPPGAPRKLRRRRRRRKG